MYNKKEKEDILSTFNHLNESNLNYSSIDCYIHFSSEVNILDNVNFIHIKKLSIRVIRDLGNFDLFFKTFFSYQNLESNLVYLKIMYNLCHAVYTCIDDPKLLENINNFKSLEYLYLDLPMGQPFEFKLYNLKYLNLSGNFFICNNLPKLKEINFGENISTAKLLECPELEKCDLNSNGIIDFSSLKKLKYLKYYCDTISPLFNYKNKPLYKSLTFFECINRNKKFYLDLLNNIDNIIECMPNLEEFHLNYMKNYKEKELAIKIFTKLKSLKFIKIIHINDFSPEKLNLEEKKLILQKIHLISKKEKNQK